MLEQITPLILTFNEESNIARTLDQLSWAQDIVVVDSESTDATREILAHYPNVRVFTRRFISHADQWNFGLLQTGIKTEWVLALDADYVLTKEYVQELARLVPPGDIAGYRTKFTYCIEGKPIRGGLYPPVVVLYRRGSANYLQDGHTQRVRTSGRIESLSANILHDDRKPFAHWLTAQARYMKLEADEIRNHSWSSLNWPDRIRKLRIVAPIIVGIYCLIIRGLVLDGKAGFFYSMQRTIAEMILSLYLLEGDLSKDKR